MVFGNSVITRLLIEVVIICKGHMPKVFSRPKYVQVLAIVEAALIYYGFIEGYIGLICQSCKLVNHCVVSGHHFFIGAIVFNNISNELQGLSGSCDTNFKVGIVASQEG